MIDILMATYNGESYLRPQLDSIIKQTNQEWRLIIRDDCSTDGTMDILNEYAKQYSEQIIILQGEQPSGSAQNNFYQLIQYCRQYSEAPYIMLADQDDVWLPKKIAQTLEKMYEMESRYGTERPLLVHTDLTVVDEKLRVINNSMFDMHNMDATRNRLNNILVQNIVTGCTVMVNRALLNKITTIPQQSVMHDMWLALIAAAFGQIGFVENATMLYRQHEQNVNGAKDMKTLTYFLSKLANTKAVHKGLVQQYQQAEEFLQIYFNELNLQQRELLHGYSQMEQYSAWKKYRVLNQYQLYKKGFVRKIGQVLL